MRLTNALGVISLTFSLVASREIPTHDSKVVLSLQQTLALYLLAIDSKSFVALDQVLAQDVVANYSAPLGVLNGLLTVESVLQTSLAPVLTQHSLSTFSVTELNTESASTVAYYTANHFGQGAYYGQVYYAYGQYVDQWAVVERSWKIKHRQLNYMGPGIGNISVFS